MPEVILSKTISFQISVLFVLFGKSFVVPLLVLIFFAAQFCLIFKETNIGVFIVASLTQLFEKLQLTGFLLIIVSFVILFILMPVPVKA